MRKGLAVTLGAITAILVVASWIACAAVAIGGQYFGWREIFVDANVAGGVVILLLSMPAAGLAQTLFGLPAAGAAWLGERLADEESAAATVNESYPDYY